MVAEEVGHRRSSSGPVGSVLASLERRAARLVAWKVEEKAKILEEGLRSEEAKAAVDQLQSSAEKAEVTADEAKVVSGVGRRKRSGCGKRTRGPNRTSQAPPARYWPVLEGLEVQADPVGSESLLHAWKRLKKGRLRARGTTRAASGLGTVAGFRRENGCAERVRR